MALLNEQIEGKYEILEKMREGGMGAIYKVRHRLLDEVRVVKVIRSQMDPGGEGGERFLREARAAIKLRHPNVAVLHDFAIAEDGQAFIVMELIDGWTLLEVLQGYGPPPVALTLEIARHSLKALGYLHRHKIVHRDVSPDNLMLTRDVDGNPLVKLIDLGIAKTLEGQGGITSSGIFLGKPRYGSPERLSGGAWDERSDLYSFGVVLYELLTGRCPITGNDATALMAGHLFRPPLDFSETDSEGRVPEDLRRIVMKALAKKPEERTASADDFIWDLTMLQDRFPLTRADLDSVWGALVPLDPGSTAATALPGSTQNRLDLEFGMVKTATAGPLLGAETVRTRERESPATVLAFPVQPETVRTALPLDLDATWASRELRKSSGPAAAPAVEEAPPARGAAVARPSRGRLILGVVAAVLALLGGGGWWLLRSSGAPPAGPEPAPAAPSNTVSTAAVPAPVRQLPPDAPAMAEPPAPTASSPDPPPEKRAEPAAVPEPSPPAPLEPMKPGDLILRGQPGVEPPEVRDFPAYSYPETMKGSGRQGTVRVAVLVDENGSVVETQVRGGDPGFNEVALEAAKKARFFPALRDGIAGKMWTELLFEFAE